MGNPAADRLALAHQRSLLALSAGITSYTTSVALGADPAAIDVWYFAVVDSLISQVQASHAVARRMSSEFLPRHARMSGVDLRPVPASLDMQRARTALRVTGPVAFKQAIAAGMDESEAVRTMATRMSGASQRLVLAGDRDTTEQTLAASKGAAGYRRRLSGRSCGFCAMLASRGAVYWSAKSATVAKDGMRFHDHCDCWAEPTYPGDQESPEVRLLQRQWQRVTAGLSGKAARSEWRRHWESVVPAERRAVSGVKPRAAAATPSPVPLAGAVEPGQGFLIREALMSASSIPDLQAAFTAEAQRITGRRIPARFGRNADLDTAREHAEGVLLSLERYPDAKLDGLDFIDSTFAAPVRGRDQIYAQAWSDGEIQFNLRWADEAGRGDYLDALSRDAASGWSVRNSGTPGAVAIHEFGHVLDMATLGEVVAPKAKALAERLAKKAGLSTDDFIRREVSGYATSSADELVAEAFLDAMLNGPRASELSRGILALIDAEYAKGGRKLVRTVSAPRRAAAAMSGEAREIEVEGRIFAAYRQLARKAEGEVGGAKAVALADLRDALPDIPRAEMDAALKRLSLQDGVTVASVQNLKSISPKFGADPRFMDAAVKIGGEDSHLIAISAAAKPRALPAPRVKVSTKKSRTGQPDGYPKRQRVPDAKADPSTPFPAYDPPEYTAPSVIANDRTKKPGGWADPEDPRKVGPFRSPIQVDEQGRPINPYTRTGIQGRGLLGKWGPNQAADPIVTRVNPRTGKLEIAVIRRGDTGEWAIPGGMVDDGEQLSAALRRELKEETGADLDMASAREVYRGFVDDPRNTDNAWMETTVMHRHLTPEEAAKVEFSQAAIESGEVRAIRWVEVDDEFLGKLYASHGDFVRAALKDFDPPARIPQFGLPAGVTQADADRMLELARRIDTRAIPGTEQALFIRSSKLKASDKEWLAAQAKAHPDLYLRMLQQVNLERRLEEFAERAGITVAQAKQRITAEFRDLIADAPIVVRVPDEAVVRSILADGRIRTQFDEGVTRAGELKVALRPRQEAEGANFGIPRDAPAAERPVYGVIEPDGIRAAASPDDELASYYGEIQIVLKSDVRARATATWTDTLDSFDSARPSPIGDPSWESAYPGAMGALKTAEYRKRSYVEAQVHGGVRTADIEELVFPAMPSPATAKALGDAGIRWRVLDASAKPTKAVKKAVKAKPELTPEQQVRDLLAGKTPAPAIPKSGPASTGYATATVDELREIASKRIGHLGPVSKRATREQLLAAVRADMDLTDVNVFKRESARLQQLRVDRANQVADLLAEADELIFKGVTPQVMERVLGQAARTAGPLAEAQLAAVIKAMQLRDPVKIRAALDRIATKAKVRLELRAGDITAAREGMELVTGGGVRPGVEVRVVRPGTVATMPDGQVVVLKRPVVREVDLEEKARIRQEAIDAVRESSDVLREASELVANGATPAVIRERVGIRLARIKSPDPAIKAFQRAIATGDVEKIRKAIPAAAKKLGIKQVDEAGELTLFNPKRHQGIAGSSIREGRDVRVVRPGYAWEYQGKPVELSRPVVEELSTAEVAKLRQASVDTSKGLVELAETLDGGPAQRRIAIEASALPDDVKAVLLAASKVSPAKLKTTLTAQLKKRGVVVAKVPKTPVKYDPNLHEVKGGPVPVGSKVKVIQPEVTMTYRGETVVVRKGVVEAAEKAESKYAARQAAVRDVADTPGAVERPLSSARGVQAITTEIHAPDGRRIIQKKFIGEQGASLKRAADAEELGSRVLEAVGVRSPAVVQAGEGRVLMEFIDGDLALTVRDPYSLASTDDGRLIGLADMLMRNGDRHYGNWFVLPDGHLAGIDHSGAFFEGNRMAGVLKGKFADYLVTRGGNGRPIWQWRTDISKADLAVIRRRLEALRPEFVRLRRIAWYDNMMANLVEIEKRAAGTVDRIAT